MLGSNQRRLSRRFYRPLSLCTSKNAADQRICAGQMRFSISYAFMASESGELARPRTGSREATDAPGRSGYADRPPALLPRRLACPPPRKRPGCAADDTPQLNHFQHVSASTAQSLLPAKGRLGARVAAVMRVAHLPGTGSHDAPDLVVLAASQCLARGGVMHRACGLQGRRLAAGTGGGPENGRYVVSCVKLSGGDIHHQVIGFDVGEGETAVVEAVESDDCGQREPLVAVDERVVAGDGVQQRGCLGVQVRIGILAECGGLGAPGQLPAGRSRSGPRVRSATCRSSGRVR